MTESQLIERVNALLVASCVLIAYGICYMFLSLEDRSRIDKPVIPHEGQSESTPTPLPSLIPPITAKTTTVEYSADIEESPEDFSVVLYATEPIGRYYITAYNHEETGSKITASGTTCHEGTITTAAADVWGGYFKFGDYIEVSVNGEPKLFRIEDTGRLVKKRHVDLYFASYRSMAKYGSNYQTIYKVTFPFGKPKDI